MKNIFNSVKLFRPKRNAFDLTHDVKLSLDMGKLVPIMVTETIPGDTFKISGEALIRFAPMVAPVMHRFDISIHYFFVPNRILWDNWEKWITGDAQETVQFPRINYNSTYYGPLMDYMGLPEPPPAGLSGINPMPFAAYQAIYHEYYRDQNLVAEFDYKLTDGVQDGTKTTTLTTMRTRAWEHDYFTAALPFAQKGPAVDIPLGDVTLIDDWTDAPGNPVFRQSSGGVGAGAVSSETAGILGQRIAVGGAGVNDPVVYDPMGTLQTEPTTINDLRRAFKLQEWLEKNARAGTRYIESIFAHFGVKSPDARLQRPEYITGVKSPVVISEVLNTTGQLIDETTPGLPQGNMAGHGVGVAQGKFGSYYCYEHGYIIGIMSVMPKTAYVNNIPRHFLKIDDRFEYFWPEFAHIGEQEVWQSEVYSATSESASKDTFGYVPRYAEYRFENSRVAGDFRTTLNYWHLSREFSAAPALNQEFIECVPGKRIFAVTDENVNSLYAHVLNRVTAIRPIPKFGTPIM